MAKQYEGDFVWSGTGMDGQEDRKGQAQERNDHGHATEHNFRDTIWV